MDVQWDEDEKLEETLERRRMDSWKSCTRYQS